MSVILSTRQLKHAAIRAATVIRMLLKKTKTSYFQKSSSIQSTTLFSSPSDIQIVPNEPCKINYLSNALHASETKQWSHDEYINRHYSLQIVLLHLHCISTGNHSMCSVYSSIMFVLLKCSLARSTLCAST